MSDRTIRVENLSKAFRIGIKDAIPDTSVGAFASWVRSPARNLRRLRRLDTSRRNGEAQDIIWALRNVCFDVEEGEVVGIVGRNGAGKSTLLKILSRITQPTSGRALIRGRISSLLEVGTGFHPELTGRENVYMNGTILGMRKLEIDRKFDEIVEFSGVERFLDTPIKRYSSGMKVRLAFSVAAHLEPEVLMVDEVLAVGDHEFQRKCLGKMDEVSQRGRTVLFVSHNMAAVVSLCSRCIYLTNGRVRLVGEAATVVDKYLSADTKRGSEWTLNAGLEADKRGNIARLLSVKVVNGEGEVRPRFDIEKPIRVKMEFEVLRADCHVLPKSVISTSTGTVAFVTHDVNCIDAGGCSEAGCYESIFQIPGNYLAEGDYSVTASIVSYNPDETHSRVSNCVVFTVIDGNAGGSVRRTYQGPYPGVVRPLLTWSTERQP